MHWDLEIEPNGRSMDRPDPSAGELGRRHAAYYVPYVGVGGVTAEVINHLQLLEEYVVPLVPGSRGFLGFLVSSVQFQVSSDAQFASYHLHCNLKLRAILLRFIGDMETMLHLYYVLTYLTSRLSHAGGVGACTRPLSSCLAAWLLSL
jgi:hypothetical protein